MTVIGKKYRHGAIEVIFELKYHGHTAKPGTHFYIVVIIFNDRPNAVELASGGAVFRFCNKGFTSFLKKIKDCPGQVARAYLFCCNFRILVAKINLYLVGNT